MRDEGEIKARRQRLSCTNVGDPCAYDHTCLNHRLLAEMEHDLAEARAERDHERRKIQIADEAYLQAEAEIASLTAACLAAEQSVGMLMEERDRLRESLRFARIAKGVRL